MDLIILDWTRMGHQFCLAGAIVQDGQYRIVPSTTAQALLKSRSVLPERTGLRLRLGRYLQTSSLCSLWLARYTNVAPRSVPAERTYPSRTPILLPSSTYALPTILAQHPALL
jgi:hypothetical protein